MDRTEATGLGIAFAGHAALFALLATGFAATQLPPLKKDPIEIELVTEQVALESTAPSPSAETPAPLLAPVEGPPEPAPSPPSPAPEPAPMPRVEPAPQPRVTPTPTPPPPAPAPKAVQRPAPPPPRPAPKAVQRPAPPAPAPEAAERPRPAPPAPAKATPRPQPATPSTKTAQLKAAVSKGAGPAQQPAQKSANGPTGRLTGLLNGLSSRDTPSKVITPPAQKAGPAVAAGLAAEVRRQLKPYWKSPTGADVELLRTTVRVSLTRSGAIADIGAVTTSGQNASNSTQVKLHQEQAIRAVRLAAPFRLPAEYYDEWKDIAPVFDRRL
jgi:outer membrane biosynthesis protein TonB